MAAKPKSSRAPSDGTSTPLELSPGVRAGTSTIQTADDAAARAVSLAEKAGKQGSFAVGGLLVDEFGRVIAEATNAVIRNDHLSDPTAHVERQLVDWLAHERRRGLSLSPRNVTIVSSLDPCAMCAGAILRSGMRVIIVAEDNFAGVHENLKPRHMPRELQAQAQRRHGVFRRAREAAEACPRSSNFRLGCVCRTCCTVDGHLLSIGKRGSTKGWRARIRDRTSNF